MAAIQGSLATGDSPASTTHEEDHHSSTNRHVAIPTTLAAALSDVANKDGKLGTVRFHMESSGRELSSPQLRSNCAHRTKGTGLAAPGTAKQTPMQLLDLPEDILREIVQAVTHSNDLTSLALCHSALHRLAIPHIYSRFDIVWPDTNTHAEPRAGVDALTYGLATLVMAEDVFGETDSRRAYNRSGSNGTKRASDLTIRRRRGNHYAQFTRKFSLGNGPADWVQEYCINKEGGKMLGTLVALAVARMRSLETFVWDMPTGILRDVWLALSSLGDRDDGQPCRLEKLWVRWHDNSVIEPPGPMPPPTGNPGVMPAPTLQPGTIPSLNPTSPSRLQCAALDRVEHPSFSILSPVRSLSVLEIDELAYLDEMAVLIGHSVGKLKELRVGLGKRAIVQEWARIWDDHNVHQVDYQSPTAACLTIGQRRLGGVLGVLFGWICVMRPHEAGPSHSMPVSVPQHAEAGPLLNVSSMPSTSGDEIDTTQSPDELHGSVVPPSQTPVSESGLSSSPAAHGNESAPEGGMPLEIPDEIQNATPSSSAMQSEQEPMNADQKRPSDDQTETGQSQRPPDKKLALESLEMERFPLEISVLQRAIDWEKLTSLTVLHCQNDEDLWRTLRRTYTPNPRTNPALLTGTSGSPSKKSRSSSSRLDSDLAYPLKLKKIHTNCVTPALIYFLKESLAPNTLEVLFLQEARDSSSVSVDQIYKGPLRRHRESLRKILIDSSERDFEGMPTNSSKWKQWMMTKEILTFVCSGKMPMIRELGMALSHRDWVRIHRASSPA